ncbi:MAG: M23 family metallopeptidase [Saprospiraceae bacterium]|nr:M23 family metallopeptidase [Saprospiraceae bacterium]
MSKIKYVYNPQTLQFEPHRPPLKSKLTKIGGFISMMIVSCVGFYFVVNEYFPTPQEQALEREIDQMQYTYSGLIEDFNILAGDLEKLHQKDSEVHRMIFGINPMDEGIWEGGIGGVDRYENLRNLRESGEIITESLSKVEKIKRKVDLQNKSLDTLYRLALEKEKRLAAIPSIKPVVEDALKRKMRNLSGYGIRLHPVHKVKKLHTGIDFTAPRGTPIQATGNGTVIRVENRKSGYGKNVVIDHGYGFTSLYAHMQKVNVKKGQKVVKGQQIGEVGSTGTSTAPHCHYEVRVNGRAVNPIDYCLDGLSPEEYKELVEKASVENQSFD